MGGQLADMAFTDPPYNVDYGNRAKDKMRGKDRRILNDALGEGFYQFLLRHLRQPAVVTKGACYVCMSSSELHTLQTRLHRRRRQVVDLHHLGEEHLHPRPGRLPAPVRADPLWLEAGQRSLLVRRPRPGRRLVRRQAAGQRPASDHEAGGTGRARHHQFLARAGTSCSISSAAPARR